MDSPAFTQNYPTGRLVLRTSCHERPENMDRLAGDDRFCHSCNKVVHNLVGKSESEIKALFQAHGGRLCGAMTHPNFRPKHEIRFTHPATKPSYFKQLAATASLLLLYQGMMSAPTHKPAFTWQMPAEITPDGGREHHSEPDWSQNTLVSAVILNQDSLDLGFEFTVYIYANQALIRKVTASHGFFKIDLAGKVSPETTIEVAILKNTAHYERNPHSKIEHGGARRAVKLRDAQNLVLTVQYEFPETLLGDMGWEENTEFEVEPILNPEGNAPSVNGL